MKQRWKEGETELDRRRWLSERRDYCANHDSTFHPCSLTRYGHSLRFVSKVSLIKVSSPLTKRHLHGVITHIQ